MRGDSLRDLYAKVLALCGLGLLAGAGALVDYWPVQEELPRVASGRSEPRLSLPSVDVDIPVRAASVVREPAAIADAGIRPVEPQPLPIPPSAIAVETSTVAAVVGRGIQELAPPPIAAPPVEALPVVAYAAIPLPESSLTGLLPAPFEALEAAGHHHGDGDGFLSSALKKTGAVASTSLVKTGDAIVKGGVVAGASIVDVFRGLAGAVKKVSPFNP